MQKLKENKKQNGNEQSVYLETGVIQFKPSIWNHLHFLNVMRLCIYKCTCQFIYPRVGLGIYLPCTVYRCIDWISGRWRISYWNYISCDFSFRSHSIIVMNPANWNKESLPCKIALSFGIKRKRKKNILK